MSVEKIKLKLAKHKEMEEKGYSGGVYGYSDYYIILSSMRPSVEEVRYLLSIIEQAENALNEAYNYINDSEDIIRGEFGRGLCPEIHQTKDIVYDALKAIRGEE